MKPCFDILFPFGSKFKPPCLICLTWLQYLMPNTYNWTGIAR